MTLLVTDLANAISQLGREHKRPTAVRVRGMG